MVAVGEDHGPATDILAKCVPGAGTGEHFQSEERDRLSRIRSI